MNKPRPACVAAGQALWKWTARYTAFVDPWTSGIFMPVRSFICGCCQPVYAELLRPRGVAFSIAAIGAAQAVASVFGFGLPCAFHALTGVPCPGCGLTRSVLACVHGRISESLYLHPFGPALVVALGVALVAAVLPESLRQRLLGGIAYVEAKTGLTAVGLSLLMLVWALRVFHLIPLASV